MDFDNYDYKLENVINNKNHLLDMKYVVKYTKWLLRFLGVWPSGSTNIERMASKFAMLLSSSIMIILIVPSWTHIALKRADRLEFIVLLGPLTFQTSNVIKHGIMLYRSRWIKMCVEHMEIDWRRIGNSEEREIMMRYVRLGHRFTIVCGICLYSGAVLYSGVMPLCVGDTINELNETVRPLVFPGTDIFIDSQANVTYEMVFTGHLVAVIVNFTMCAAVCNIATVLIGHACGQIEIIVWRLEDLFNVTVDDDIGVIKNRMAFIVRNHVRLLKFIKNVETIMRELCLMEVMAATLIICLLEYYCITEWSNSNRVAMITYILLLVSFSTTLFMYCQFGEVLKEKCQKIGKAAYVVEWYKQPGKTKLALIMIITMGNYPCKLTAGRMMELSIASFASVMKTSLAYLNMLRKIT